MRAVKEIFVIVTKDIDSLEYISEMNAMASEKLVDTLDIEEESIFKKCDLDPDGF